MNATAKLLRIVENAKGDDLERAERAFAGMTDEQLDRQYGHSGQSHRSILEGYRKERDEWEAAHQLAQAKAGGRAERQRVINIILEDLGNQQFCLTDERLTRKALLGDEYVPLAERLAAKAAERRLT